MILPRVVYLESSALLAWLFNEPTQGDQVRALVSDARHVITSALTLVEGHRAIHRGAFMGRFSPVESLALQRYLDHVAKSWIVLELDREVVDRASGVFAGPPIRTLDALHVASALQAASQFGHVELLSLDDRVRSCATHAGLSVTPPAI